MAESGLPSRRANPGRVAAANAVDTMEAQAGQGVPDMERFREEQLESEWRRKAVDKLLTVFYRINYLVVGLLLIFWIVETLVPHAPQVITERTMLTLIGASAVQLGALAGFVGKSLATRS